MKRIAIIGNPLAGDGSYPRVLSESRSQLWGLTVDYLMVKSPDEMMRTCAGLNPEHYSAVVVVGGDGTFHHAIQGLAQRPVDEQIPVYVFPSGTANDLANSLGTHANWQHFLKMHRSQQIDAIDLIEVNGKKFATVAGIGMGAFTTTELNQLRSRSRLFRFFSRLLREHIYPLFAFRTAVKYWGFQQTLLIRSDRSSAKVKSGCVFFCNQSHLGKGLIVAKNKKNTDGQMRVLVIPRSGGLPLIRALLSLKNGIFPPDFISFSAESVRVSDVGGAPLQVFGDGENMLTARVLDFRLLPRALKVFSVHSPVSMLNSVPISPIALVSERNFYEERL